ncbi:hypothetical protein N7467_009569 [Penicillium canescens]|nr:hypothetical protein N7467_009569 [Penicillium canescens]
MITLGNQTHLPDKAFEAMVDHVTSEPQKYSSAVFDFASPFCKSEKIRDYLVTLLDKTQDWDDRRAFEVIIALEQRLYSPKTSSTLFYIN